MLPNLRKLVYASDLGDNAAMVFAHAVALAQRHDAQITFVHALEPLGPTARSLVRNMVPEDQLQRLESEGFRRVRAEIERRIERFCEAELGAAEAARSVVEAIRIVEGHAADVIIDQARDCAADLIIVGSHSRKGIQRVLLGSVAQKVTSQADRPVLLVPIPEDVK